MWLDHFARVLRYAVRGLMRSPVFAVAVISSAHQLASRLHAIMPARPGRIPSETGFLAPKTPSDLPLLSGRRDITLGQAVATFRGVLSRRSWDLPPDLLTC